MARDAYWFSHDSNARDDPKCSTLIEQLGLEGYGIYWVLVETLRDQDGYRYPLALLPSLARKYLTTPEKMKVVVGNYGLFIVDDNEFFLSKSLCKRMVKWDATCEKQRIKGVKSGEKRRLQAAKRATVEPRFNRGSTVAQLEQNRTRQDDIYEKQHTNVSSSELVVGMDVLLKMCQTIGVEASQHWRTERGHEYCAAQVVEMDRQGERIRNPRQWLLSALQNNWAKWQPPFPKADQNCPQCSGQGVVVDLLANITRPCYCVQTKGDLMITPQPAPVSEALSSGRNSVAALTAIVAGKLQA